MKRLLVALIIMSVMIVPVEAQGSDNGPIYRGGTVIIDPLSEYVFNWTWWGLDYGNWLSFYFTSNDMSTPLYLTMWRYMNVHPTIEVYDYQYTHIWNKSLGQFPSSNEVWLFRMQNIANKSVNVTIGFYYNVTIPNMNPSGYILFTAEFVVGTACLLLIVGEVLVRRRRESYINRGLHG